MKLGSLFGPNPKKNTLRSGQVEKQGPYRQRPEMEKRTVRLRIAGARRGREES